MSHSPADSAVHRQKQQMHELFDEVAEVYASAGFFTQFGRSLVRWSEVPRGARILDLAAGRGAIFDHLQAEAEPAFAVAVDLSTSMISQLRSGTASRAGRTGFAVMDAETLSFADRSFDVVLCGFALNMIPRADRALREIYRVLRPGGLFAASVPAPALSNPFPPYSALIAEFSQLVDPSRWTMSELVHPRRLLAESGFQEVVQAHDEAAIEVRDPAEFWEMEMAHGLRGFYKALPGPARESFESKFRRVVAPPPGGKRLIGRGALFFRGRKTVTEERAAR